jgi:general secretion pathway protein G
MDLMDTPLLPHPDCEDLHAGDNARMRRVRGFTLLEMVAVVAIIGLLMTLVGTQIAEQLDRTRVQTSKAKISQVGQALEMYRLDSGRYPTTEQGLQALLTKPTTNPEPRRYLPGGYLKSRNNIEDSWGNRLQYASPGTQNTRSFDIWSLGGDGIPGGEESRGDFGNWDEAEVTGR